MHICHHCGDRETPTLAKKGIDLNADDDSHNIWLAMHIFYDSWLYRGWNRNGSMFCSFCKDSVLQPVQRENEYIKKYYILSRDIQPLKDRFCINV